MRLLTTLVLGLVVALGASPAVATARPAPSFPDVIDLPSGFSPEGIDIGRGTTFYVGSLADGTIYRGDLRTGDGQVITDPVGPFSTIGIEVDRRERVWVAGGPSGTGRVYDGRTGELLASYDLTGPNESFVNDVVVTRDAAWFTDSGTANDPDPASFVFAGEPRLFKVPLGAGGRLPGQDAVETIELDAPDVTFPNLNGIETAPGRRGLVVAHTALGSLFAVDPTTGVTEEIELDVELQGADGLVRRGRTVYVVENGAAQISAVRLDRRSTAGHVVSVFPVTGSETPTTAALFGRAIYAVDAKFATMTDPFQVFRVELRDGVRPTTR